MAHETDKADNACPAPDDPLDGEYRELMALGRRDGCKCGITLVCQCLISPQTGEVAPST